MKYIKLFEDYSNKLSNEKIYDICKEYRIYAVTILEDGSVDVNGSVDLSNYGFTELPLKFNKVKGDFFCNDNSLLTLKGSPKEVSGRFDCSYNILTSLDFSPIYVKNFNCRNNKLKTLVGGPDNLEYYTCSSNELTTLVGGPKNVKGLFSCENNFLTSLEGMPISDYIVANKNPLMTSNGFADISPISFGLTQTPIGRIWDLFPAADGNRKPDNFIELFNFYEPIKLINGKWTVIIEVLNYLLDELGYKELPTDIESLRMIIPEDYEILIY